jgi:hypothetical protein
MKVRHLLILTLGVGPAGCHTEDCHDPLSPGDVFEVTVEAHQETLSACGGGVRPSPGDTFVVSAGEVVDASGRCTALTLTGERPSFVPVEYGSCAHGRPQTLRCASETPDEQVCRSTAELRVSGFEAAPGVGELRITSTRLTQDTGNQCTQPLEDCGDVYSVTIRRMD